MRNLCLLMLISIIVVSCQTRTDTKDNSATAKKEYTIGYKLAALETGGGISEGDLIVKRFENLLQQLDEKYDLNKQQIGDMTYKIKEIGEERGLNISMIQVMEGATQVRHEEYPTYLGSYLTLKEKGYKHEDILQSLMLLH